MQGKGEQRREERRIGAEKVKERCRKRDWSRGERGIVQGKGRNAGKGRAGRSEGGAVQEGQTRSPRAPFPFPSHSIPVPSRSIPAIPGDPGPARSQWAWPTIRPRPRAVPAPLLPPWPRPLPPGHAPEPTKLSLPLWPRSLRLYAPPSAHRSPAAARLGHASFALRPRPPLPPRLPVVPRVGRALTWPHRAAILCSRADRGRGERAPSGTLRAQPDPRPAAPDDAGGFVDSFFFSPFEPFFFSPPGPPRRAPARIPRPWR